MSIRSIGYGLWPAPEGTSLGYSYATGSWRVPAGIRHARFRVTDSRIGFEATNQYYYLPQDLVEKVVNCEVILSGNEFR